MGKMKYNKYILKNNETGYLKNTACPSIRGVVGITRKIYGCL